MNKTADTILTHLSGQVDYVPLPELIEEAQQALMNDMLALIGEDEQIESNDGFGNTVMVDSPLNDVRAELRQKIRHYFGQDNQGGKT